MYEIKQLVKFNVSLYITTNCRFGIFFQNKAFGEKIMLIKFLALNKSSINSKYDMLVMTISWLDGNY